MIIRSNNFNLQQITDSGQCFRMNKLEEDRYSLIAYGEYIELTQLDRELVEIDCSQEEYDSLWKHYFDLDYDYDRIVQCLKSGDDQFLSRAAEFGYGLRILRQEPFEILISFIISQNKNIPAIKSTVEKLCRFYGERKERVYEEGERKVSYYTFPTPGALAEARIEDLRAAGLGYRDNYVIRAAQAVLNEELDLSLLSTSNYDEAMMKLKNLHGVGDKVANCVSLFALHHIDAYPVDVWIARILEQVYNNKFNWDDYKGFAGIVQQYMFYYIRSRD